MSVALLVAGEDLSCMTLAGVRAGTGRRTIWEQSEAGTLAATLVADRVGGPASKALRIGSPVELWLVTDPGRYPGAALMDDDAGPASADDRLWAGRVTDVTVTRVAGEWMHAVTAAGVLSELARTPIGDEPWPQESDSDRIRRVLDLTGYPSGGVPVVTGPALLPRDVDSTDALGVLKDAAASGGGLLWEDHRADAPGSQALVSYNPAVARTLTQRVVWDQLVGSWDEQQWTWNEGPAGRAVWEIPPCTVLAGPLTWMQGSGDVVRYCRVEYGDADPQPYAESGSRVPPVYGRKIATDLAEQGAAAELAARTVLTQGQPRWMLPTVTIAAGLMTAGDRANLPRLLVGGQPVRLTRLPAGSPVSELVGFIEGWEHTFQPSTLGGVVWDVVVSVSDAALTAPMTTWDQLAGSWDDYTIPWDTLDWEG